MQMCEIDHVLARYLTTKLTQFRTQLEKTSGHSIDTLEVDAALMLSDLCRFLGLEEAQHNRVLGDAGIASVLDHLEHRSPESEPEPAPAQTPSNGGNGKHALIHTCG